MRPFSILAAAALAVASLAPLPLVTPPVQARATVCRSHVPAAGSAERKAILNALRPHIEAFVGHPVEFVVGKLDVACGYARLLATPQEKGGQGDHYEDVDALMIKRNGRWTFGMLASGEPDSDPAADQFKARFPHAPESLLYL